MSINRAIIGDNPFAAMYAYSGKTDVAFSLLLPLLLVGAWGDWGWTHSTVQALRILSFGLIALSLFDAWRANRCWWRALLMLPVKYVLVTCAVFCALLALTGAMAALAKGISAKERLGQAAVAGISAYGLVVVRRWVKTLTRPQPAEGDIAGQPKPIALGKRHA